MKKPKSVTVRFTKDELLLIKFLINHRNDDNSANLYQSYVDSLGETHVGLKVVEALTKLE